MQSSLHPHSYTCHLPVIYLLITHLTDSFLLRYLRLTPHYGSYLACKHHTNRVRTLVIYLGLNLSLEKSLYEHYADGDQTGEEEEGNDGPENPKTRASVAQDVCGAVARRYLIEGHKPANQRVVGYLLSPLLPILLSLIFLSGDIFSRHALEE